MFQNIG